jgi:hypothetical protein
MRYNYNLNLEFNCMLYFNFFNPFLIFYKAFYMILPSLVLLFTNDSIKIEALNIFSRLGQRLGQDETKTHLLKPIVSLFEVMFMTLFYKLLYFCYSLNLTFFSLQDLRSQKFYLILLLLRNLYINLEFLPFFSNYYLFIWNL